MCRREIKRQRSHHHQRSDNELSDQQNAERCPCGCEARVTEVTGANRADIRVHEETGRPVLRVRGKGNKVRDLPLTPATVAAKVVSA